MSKLSVIVPVYYNQENLDKTIPILLEIKEKIKNDELELVFVEDGSKDKSFEILTEHQKKHPNTIRILKLTRNFGSMAAIQAGLTKATGDCAAIISADLQDPPEMLVEMFSYWKKGIKAVYSIRKNRDDSFSEKLFSKIYYLTFKKFAIKEYPSGGFDFFLIDREIIDQLNLINESHSNIMALIFWLGYPSIMLPYTRAQRIKGTSKWTFSKKFKLFVDSFISFSYLPIKLISSFGLLYAFASFLYASYLVYLKLTGGTQLRGWTTLMVFMSFTYGLTLIMLGILGEYIWRILDTIKKRPNYVIEKEIESSDE